jgi:hypothetical protein
MPDVSVGYQKNLFILTMFQKSEFECNTSGVPYNCTYKDTENFVLGYYKIKVFFLSIFLFLVFSSIL